MFSITVKIFISASAKDVFLTLCFFFESSDNYRKWNKDHISCKWEKGSLFKKGSIFTAEELLHGEPHKLRFRISETMNDRGFRYKFLFPFSMLFGESSFFISSINSGKASLEANISFRLPRMAVFLFKNKIDMLTAHMKEEGLEIKRVSEENGNRKVPDFNMT